MMFLVFRFLALLMLFPTLANAFTCSAPNATATLDVNVGSSVTVPTSLSIGDMIAEYTGSAVTISTCTDTSGITSDIFVINSGGTYAMTASDGTWVFKSDVESIGYAFGGIASQCGSTQWITNGTWSATLCKSSTGALASTFTFTPKVRLYKLGGAINNASLPRHYVGNATRTVNNTLYSGPLFYATSATLNVPACSVNTQTISVDMGTVEKRKFTGVGSTTEANSFSIDLTCTAKSSVYVLMSGNVSDTTNGLLKLTNSTASGVLIQLLYNGSPVKFNSLFPVGTTSRGQVSIPLQARYYQSGTITAGTANSSVTFTMVYN